MARIKGLTIDEAPTDLREIFEGQKSNYGFILNSNSVLALRPTIFKGVRALSEGLKASGLIEDGLRHLVCVKSAAINGCPY